MIPEKLWKGYFFFKRSGEMIEIIVILVLAILFTYVLVQRIREYKNDKYKDVEK